MDTAGLELAGGDLVRSVEETGWMSAARGDDGSTGALGSHHYIYNSPVDYKVPYLQIHSVFQEQTNAV